MAKTEVLININANTNNAEQNIKKLDKELDKVSKSAHDAKKSAGAIGETASQLPGPLGAGVSAVQQLGTAFKALFASPIGIIVGLFAGLIALLSRLDPVVDKIEQGMDALTAVFDTLAGNLEKVAKLWFQIVTFQYGDAIDSAKELGNAIGDAASEAIRLRKAIQELEDVENDYVVTQAKNEAAVKNLLIQAKNVNLSYKEKEKLLKEASRIEQEDFEQGLKIAKAKADIAKAELARIDKAGVDRGAAAQKAAAAEAELIRFQSSSADLQEKIQNRLDNVRQQAKEKQKAIEQKRKERHEAELKRLEELAKKEEEALLKRNQFQIKYNNSVLDLRAEIAKQIEDEDLRKMEASNEEDRIEYERQQRIEAERRKDIEEEKKKNQIILESRVALASGTASVLRQVADLAGQQSESGKALSAAATLIETYVAAFRAYSEGFKIDPTGTFSIISAAAAAATGLKAVQNILSTNAQGITSAGGGVAAPAPITRPTASLVQVGNNNPIQVDTGKNSQRVYVVESDISDVQNKVKVIEDRATVK